MRFEIELEGRRKLLDTLREKDRAVVKGIREAVRTSAREVRAEARRNVPRFQGNLRRAIKFRSWAKFLSATVFVDRKVAPHTHLVIRGRGPGKIPSAKNERLAMWARRHGISPYALARAIGKRGTRPAAEPDFMVRAFQGLRPGIVGRIKAAFEAAFK